MIELELVLPCYNEGHSLKSLIERTSRSAIEFGFTPDTFQLVIVDNGSQDNSKSILNYLKATDQGSWFRIVCVPINRGYGNGIWLGLLACEARYLAWSHADQQCDPIEVFRAYRKLLTSGGRVLVKGHRRGREPGDKLISNFFASLAYLLLGIRCVEINAQPKVFPRHLLSEIKEPPLGFQFDLYVLYRAIKVGYNIITINVDFPPREHGVSRWAGSLLSRYRTILGMLSFMVKLLVREGRV